MQILAKTDQGQVGELPRDNYWRECSALKLFKSGMEGELGRGSIYLSELQLLLLLLLNKTAHAQLYNDSLALLLLYFNINYHTLSFIPFNFLEVKVCNIFKALDLHSSVS